MKLCFSKRIKTILISLSVFLAVGFSSTLSALELTMYYPIAVGGPLTKLVDKLVGNFEAENPGINIKAIYSGNYTDTMTKAMTALRAGQPPHLSVLLSTEVFTLIDNDAIVPFDGMISSSQDKKWLKSFYPALMENGQTGGKTWGIPFQRSTIVMYYNKDAFRDAGLDPDSPPESWYHLVSMGKKLVKKDSAGNVTRWGIKIPSTGYPYWMFGALTKQNGQMLMNSLGTKTYFDEPRTIQTLQFWRDLGAVHQVMPKNTIEWGTLRSDFLEGKTAMMWHSTGNLTTVKKNAKFDFGVAMLPSGVQRGTPTGGGNFYIFKQTSPEQRAAALKFIKWMTQPQKTAEWSIGTGYIGTRADAYDTQKLKNYVKTFAPAGVARDQLKYATAELSTHENGRIIKILNDAIQSVMVGSKSPQQALQKAQKQSDRILRRYR